MKYAMPSLVISRRTFLKHAAAVSVTGLATPGCITTNHQGRALESARDGVQVNDVHSQLNPTRVSTVERPTDFNSLQRVLTNARRDGKPVIVCGGRHAGGGQQFLADHQLVDLSDMGRMIRLDQPARLVEVESGARWPGLIDQLRKAQSMRAPNTVELGIHQKQGGADELSIGGAVAANAHGRDLNSRPIVQDIESLTLIDPEGRLMRCSRDENRDRFFLVIGGYGLFGVIHTVTLRLVPRQKLVKRVRWTSADQAIGILEQHASAGAAHGDFQFAVNEQASNFLREGLLSWYEPASLDAAIRSHSPQEAFAQFDRLIRLAHSDKPIALAMYREAMLQTDGEVDWSDSWQTGDYVPDYHRTIVDRGAQAGSEILSEIYVPRESLDVFLTVAAKILRQHAASLIYGTVRLIRKDDETFLAWAKQDYACVIFNLHTQLTPTAIAKNAATFQSLLDAAIPLSGSYYLTYHRFARKDQVLSCYPQMPQFLAAKQKTDPKQHLQSDWYQFYKDLLR